jgi:hypothetical protein
MGHKSQIRCLLLVIIVLCGFCLLIMGSKLGLPISAEATAPNGAGGEEEIVVIPIQIERDTYGIAMVDKTSQTLWIYEFGNRGPAYARLKLLAARSWRYDKLLQQYNTGEPKPEQVKMILESLSKQVEQKDAVKEPNQGSTTNILETIEPNSNFGR